MPIYVDSRIYLTVVSNLCIEGFRKTRLDIAGLIDEVLERHSICVCFGHDHSMEISVELKTAVAELRAICWETMSSYERRRAERDRLKEEAELTKRAERLARCQLSDDDSTETDTDDDDDDEEEEGVSCSPGCESEREMDGVEEVENTEGDAANDEAEVEEEVETLEMVGDMRLEGISCGEVTDMSCCCFWMVAWGSCFSPRPLVLANCHDERLKSGGGRRGSGGLCR